jgi:hypothetical protein
MHNSNKSLYGQQGYPDMFRHLSPSSRDHSPNSNIKLKNHSGHNCALVTNSKCTRSFPLLAIIPLPSNWWHDAIAPAVGDRPLTTRSWVHFQSDPYWICGGIICTAKGFSQNTLVFPSHYHLINNSYSFIRLSLTQYNTKTICPWCLMDNKLQLNPVNQ